MEDRARAALDGQWMRRALRLAARADHRTSPNPMVGALVLDRRGRLAGEGFHHRAGEPHAEVLALGAAGPAARSGTVYVTLEPCAHQGRTPPCTPAVLEAAPARVVVAMADPDPRVSGTGLALLRGAGLAVDEGVLAAEARRLNEFYVKHRTTGRPFVTVKFAATLDGRTATRGGDSRWITGPAARAHAHRLRHRHDAVLVGAGTVVADDPELAARFPGARQPLKVVLDSSGRTPATARALRGEHLVDPGRDLPDLLDRLGSMGVLSVLVEGGAHVEGSFFDLGLVDKVYAYLAPRIAGGKDALPAILGDGALRIADAPELHAVRVRRLGPDLLVSGYVVRAEAAAARPDPRS